MLRNFKEALRRQDWLALFMELIIVILGITIAYQLNVYQQKNALNEDKRVLLENLRIENRGNLEELSRSKQHFLKQPDQLIHLITLLQSPEPVIDSLRKSICLVYSWRYYTLNTGYLTTYIGGDIKASNELTSELIKLQYAYDELERASNLVESYRVENIYDYLFKHIDTTRDSEYFDVEALQEVSFINQVAFLMGFEREHRTKFVTALQQIHTIDSLLNVKLRY